MTASNNNNSRDNERLIQPVRAHRAVIPNTAAARQRVIFRRLYRMVTIDESEPPSFANLLQPDEIFETPGISIAAIRLYRQIFINAIRRSNNLTSDDNEMHEDDIFGNLNYDDRNQTTMIDHLNMNICVMAARYGRIDVLEWAHSLNFNIRNTDVVYCASVNLFVDVVDWCVRHGCPYDTQECMRYVRGHERSVDDCGDGTNTSIADRIESILTTGLRQESRQD